MPRETDATSRRNIARHSISPFALSPLARPSAGSLLLHPSPALGFVLSFLRLPFRPVISPQPANYAVVVASCPVIKLHLFTMKRDCHQAFDSRAASHRRFHSVRVDRPLFTRHVRVSVVIKRMLYLNPSRMIHQDLINPD